MTKIDVPELPKNGTVMHISAHFAVGVSGRNFTEREIFPYCSVEIPDDATAQPRRKPCELYCSIQHNCDLRSSTIHQR